MNTQAPAVYKRMLRRLSYGHLSTINRRAALFFLLYLGAILYLSLYPWRLLPYPGQRSLAWVPLSSRRTFLDAGLNVIFYVPLGAAAFLSIRRRALGLIAALAAGTLASFTVEELQLSIPGRFGNLTDLACNSMGSLLGVGAAMLLTSRPLAARLRALYSPKTLLVALWAVWQAFLFLPRNGPAIDVGHQVVGLLCLLAVAVSRRINRATFMFLTSLALIWLAADEFRPFQFESLPQPFSWLPFESWFVDAPDSFYGNIFGKFFFDTAIVWMERNAGMRWVWAAAVPALILSAGEFAQIYLPGRTPETTDLILLAAGAFMLHLAETG